MANLNTGKARAIFLNLLTLPTTSITAHATSSVAFGNTPAQLPNIGDYATANLSDSDPDLQWRGPDNEYQVTFFLSLDKLTQISALALCNHNLPVGTDVTLEFFQGEHLLANQVGETITVPAHRPRYAIYDLSPYAHHPYGYPLGDIDEVLWPYTDLFFNQVYCDLVKVTINATTNADGFLRMGYLSFGKAFSPARNIDKGWESSITAGQFSETPSGVTLGDQSIKKRDASIVWGSLSGTDASFLTNELLVAARFDSLTFISIMNNVGGPDEDQNAMLGYITQSTGPLFNENTLYRSFTAQVSEIQSLI